MPNVPPPRQPEIARSELSPGTDGRFPRAMALLALGALMVMAGCGGEKAKESEPVVSVQAVHVRRAEIRQQVTSEAVLYPLHQALIVPKISAPVKKFYVNRGDHVHAGQLLAVLENSDLAAAVAENKGAYEQALANYETTSAASLPEQIQKAEGAVKSAKASYKAALQLYNSSKKLYQQGALAGKQLNTAEVGLIQAQTQLETSEQQLEKLHSVQVKAMIKAAQGQVAAAKGRYENAQANLSYSEIRSPITGIVTDRPLYEGEMATAGTPLMTVMNVSQVIARAHVPDSEAALLKVGDPAEIYGSGRSKAVIGKVTVVSPALDPNSTTVQVWAQASNPGDQLKPGTPVNVTFIAKKVSNALVVPQSAVVSDSGDSHYVMVIGPDGHAHETKVETGVEQGGEVQIISGLKDGELIVSQGAYGLPNDTKVTYQTAAND